MPRNPDTVLIELTGAQASEDVKPSTFDNFTSLSITNDITQPFEAAFEVGNDGTWSEIQSSIALGTQYKVKVNGLPRITGRLEMEDIPLDSSGSSTVRYTVRTKLADAAFTTADEKIKVKNTSILDFILALYDPLGYAESDFLFDPYVARDLMTGEATDGKGEPTSVDLEPLKVDAAKVKPPETIYSAADRHLRRHGLMHWDSPDGGIVIGAPNDTQDPIFFLHAKRGTLGRGNNVLGITRTMDYSGIPSVLALMGVGGKKGRARKRLGAIKVDSDVIAAGFHRKVVMPAEGIKEQSLADRAVAREMSARSKRKDAINVEVDGLSYWDGQVSIPWGVDCVANCDIDTAGGALGSYYVHRVTLKRDPSSSDKSNLTLLKAGIWVL